MDEFETRNVVLGKQDVKTVTEHAQRTGLGPKGFSMALRMIIREWDAARVGRESKGADPNDAGGGEAQIS